MAPKTFAHGWATLTAMDRPGDHLAVGIKWSDEWVLGEDFERLLLFGLPADQLPQGAKRVAPVGKCRLAGGFELIQGVLPGQRDESSEHAVASAWLAARPYRSGGRRRACSAAGSRRRS